MRTFITQRARRVGIVLLVAGLLVSGLLGGVTAASAAPLGAVLPGPSCSVVGGVRTCELWAKTGTLTLPGGVTAPIWGYADTAGGAATLPGPTLVVDQNESVSIVLHNMLAENTSLTILGADMAPDLAGVAPAGQRAYTFTATAPGTYLYEAGLTTNAQHQVALGLYGALIVRPAGAPTQAYANPVTAFDDEALVLLSEIDPALHNSVNPAAFDFRQFKPTYRLINGKAFPQTDVIASGAGRRVLLRYANAGFGNPAMSLLGVHQQILAFDGSVQSFPQTVVGQEIAPGTTVDALVLLPATPPAGTARYTLYAPGIGLQNNGVQTAGITDFGGVLTFITIGAGTPVVGGPVATGVTATPNKTNGAQAVALAAALSDVASGNSPVTAAEYFIDAQGAAGTGTAMSGSFGAPTASVQATISAGVMGGLASGAHTIYVHGQDSSAAWGPWGFTTVVVDKTGPMIMAAAANPNPTNGAVDVLLSATGDDDMAGGGGSNVTQAEYFLGPAGAPGSGIAMQVTMPMPMAELKATILAATVGALPEGTKTVNMRARDEWNNWGMPGSVTFVLDKTGPVASNLIVTPQATNGWVGVSPTEAVVRIEAVLSDPLSGGVNSKIVNAEAWIDTAGAPGTGILLMAKDGLFDSPSEPAFFNIPLTNFRALPDGMHQILVHGKDAAGNWGATVSASIKIDKSGPVITGLNVAPNPPVAATTVVLTGLASDPSSTSNVVAAEWFEADPGQGLATAMQAVDGAFNSPAENLTASINISGWAPGLHSIKARAKDATGNWGPVVQVDMPVAGSDLIFGDGFETGNFSRWSSKVGNNCTIGNTPAFQGLYFMQAALLNNSPCYVQDNTPANETSYRARFYFRPRNTATGFSQMDIFSGLNTAGTTLFRVQYRRQGFSAPYTYQLRFGVLRTGGTPQVFTNWFNISNGPHFIEMNWQSAASATAQFYIDGTLRQTLSGLNTSPYLVDSVRLGGVGNLTFGVSGSPHFDQFESRRQTYIGP